MSRAAAATASDGSLDQLVRAVRASSAAVAVVDIASSRVVAASHRLVDLVGHDRPIEGNDALDFASDRADAQHALIEVRDGTFDAYEASRKLRRLDGSDVDVRFWVRGIERRPPRRHAVFVFSSPETRRTARREPGGDAAVGAVDDLQRVRQVSAEGQSVFGIAADGIVGRRLSDVVHPDDADAIAAVLRGAADDAVGSGSSARVRGTDGEWHAVHVSASRSESERRTGFSATLNVDTATARITELERHLIRIAREVEAAGLIRDGLQLPDPERLPELGDLTTRQWEVVTRLMRGERVSSIAGAMFLSPSTVRNYLNAIYRKVGVHSQAELLERLRS